MGSLAPRSSPCSALRFIRSVPAPAPPIIGLRNFTRNRRSSCGNHAISLAFEVQTSVRRKEARRRSRGLNVELEILRFMEQSGKPNEFPTKEELIAAGRSDLVEAAIKRGGWLTLGWQESDKNNKHRSTGDKSPQLNGRVQDSHRDAHLGSSRDNDVGDMHGEMSKKELPAEIVLKKESSSETYYTGDEFPSTTGATAEAELPSFVQSFGRRRPGRTNDILTSKIENSKPATVEASHERWRRKRRKEATKIEPDNTSVRNALDWVQDMVQMREQWLLESISKPSKQVIRSSKASDASPSSKQTTRTQVSRSSSSSSSSASKKPESTSLLLRESSSSLEKTSVVAARAAEPGSGESSFNARLRKLETKLLATRAALKSGRAALLKGEDKLMQVQRKTGEELAMAADRLEFRENDIMQTRAELRRTRAQVTALQAKMALELSEARKATEEKQILLERAEKALGMMRLVRIVWPNPASHVQLTGSFDGWTNKIKMEKSSAGVFVTALHLYPGRYEVKFIVDGTWRVDACRPITYADGIENNLLMVS